MDRLVTLRKRYEDLGNSKVTKPELIGYFSLDTNRNYQDDYSQLKYIREENIKPRRLNMDLNDKNEDRTPKTFLDDESNTSNILKFFHSHRETLDVYSSEPTCMDDVPFVTHRGALIRISNLPFTHKTELSTHVCLVNGVIYFETFYVLNFTPDGMGHKFEQYIQSDSPYSHPNTAIPNNENEEFNCIFTSSIGNHKLYYKAEMDGFLADEKSPYTKDFVNNAFNYSDSIQFIKNMSSVELKTLHLDTPEYKFSDSIKFIKNMSSVELKTLHLDMPEYKFSDSIKFIKNMSNVELKTLHLDMPEYKFSKFHSLKWWSQAYFGNVDVIACGYKNSNNHVVEIKQFKTENLCKEAKEWNPNTCFNFLDSYLQFIKEALTEELINRGYDVGRNVNVKSYPIINLTLIREPLSSVFVDRSRHSKQQPNLLSDSFLTTLKEKSRNN